MISNKKLFFQLAAAIIVIQLTTACQTVPDKMEPDAPAGHWIAKAQITNLKTKKRDVVDLDIFLRKPDRVRIEVSGTFGVSVASVLSQNEKVQIGVHTQKKYYEGSNHEKALEPVIGIQFDPQLLFPVLFDETIKQKGWSCTQGADKLPAECLRLKDDLKIEWHGRSGVLKNIHVSNAQFLMQIHVNNFKTKVEEEKVFSLSIPDSYTRHKLN